MKRLNASKQLKNFGASLTRYFAVAGVALLLSTQVFAETTPVRVGVLKFGTVNWELKSMKHGGFDQANGVDVEIVPYAGGDATKIALQGGAVDVIVSDWLWVSRQRADGQKLTFVPYSSSVGAVMVSADSDIANLQELKGKKIGVAGGPLDKSWLLLQGMAAQAYGFDLAAENEIAFGSPPLLAEKTRQGELDAMLNYWHYCARLEAEGFKRLISAEDAAKKLGASGPVSAIGYVFSDEWAAANPKAAAGFVQASRDTKKLMGESDAEWERLAESGAIKDKGAALLTLRDRFREGIPVRPVADEIVDASNLYGVLADLGGPKLVGDSPTMVEGTYWSQLVGGSE
ncbi:ABC transporter substrate-binding protein [Chromatiales bacterium (ex Bugula neritina AB1)]|nr:ABC transporter substrate-binding protein [Chromatiales bacterium (ex Bugula neritina AB1)]